MNAVRLKNGNDLVVAYYQHIFKFDNTGSLSTYGKTTVAVYPLSFVFDSSYSGEASGVLFMLYSTTSTSS